MDAFTVAVERDDLLRFRRQRDERTVRGDDDLDLGQSLFQVSQDDPLHGGMHVLFDLVDQQDATDVSLLVEGAGAHRPAI